MNSTGIKQSSVRKYSAVALFALLAAIYFSLPAIVTFDSAHYHTFIPILEGRVPFAEWDIVRGPVFPTLLFISKLLFGFGSHGFVTFSGLWYLTTVALAFSLLRTHLGGSGLSWFLVVFATVLFGADPLIIGYYHTVLTEFVAATIFVVSIGVALTWIKLDTSRDRLKFWMVNIWFAVALPLSYLLKQPYVTAAALPLCGAFLASLITTPCVRGLRNRTITLVLSFASLIVGIALWENYLPPEAKAKYTGRSSAALLSTQILQGLRGVVPVTASGQWLAENAPELREIPSAVRAELLASTGPDTCSQLFKLRGGAEYLVYKCRTGSAVEALQFVLKNLYTFPIVTTHGYLESYLEIARAKEATLFGFREHGAIAFRAFRVGQGQSNVFDISNPELASLVRGYKVDRKGEAGGWLGRLPYRWLGNYSLLLFTWTIVLAPWLCVTSLLVLIVLRFLPGGVLQRNRGFFAAIFVINFCVTMHVFVHGFLMAIIDRYAFPVYPVALLSVFLIGGWLVLGLWRCIPIARASGDL